MFRKLKANFTSTMFYKRDCYEVMFVLPFGAFVTDERGTCFVPLHKIIKFAK